MTPNRVYHSDDLIVRRYPAPARGSIPVASDVITKSSDQLYGFVLSTPTIDRMNDTIAIDGWELDYYLKNPVVLWSHDAGSLPIGRAKNVRIVGDRLLGDVQFAGTAAAQQVEHLVSEKILNAVSVGFHPIEFEFNRSRGGVDYKRQSLLEFSICNVGANPQALRLRSLSREEKIGAMRSDLAKMRAESKRQAEAARAEEIARHLSRTTPEQRKRQRERSLALVKLRMPPR